MLPELNFGPKVAQHCSFYQNNQTIIQTETIRWHRFFFGQIEVRYVFISSQRDFYLRAGDSQGMRSECSRPCWCNAKQLERNWPANLPIQPRRYRQSGIHDFDFMAWITRLHIGKGRKEERGNTVSLLCSAAANQMLLQGWHADSQVVIQWPDSHLLQRAYGWSSKHVKPLGSGQCETQGVPHAVMRRRWSHQVAKRRQKSASHHLFFPRTKRREETWLVVTEVYTHREELQRGIKHSQIKMIRVKEQHREEAETQSKKEFPPDWKWRRQFSCTGGAWSDWEGDYSSDCHTHQLITAACVFTQGRVHPRLRVYSVGTVA